MEGGSGPGFQYGRLEVFIRGFWSSVCDKNGFTPDAAQVACRQLGFDGGAAVQFTQPFQRREKEVCPCACLAYYSKRGQWCAGACQRRGLVSAGCQRPLFLSFFHALVSEDTYIMP